MAKRKGKMAQKVIKKIEEITQGISRLGQEGIKFSKAAVDTTVLTGKVEMAYYELGKKAFALISKGEVKAERLDSLIHKISQLQQRIKSAKKRFPKSKKK